MSDDANTYDPRRISRIPAKANAETDDESDIPPALTPSEWSRAAAHAKSTDDGRLTMVSMAWTVQRHEAVIALANAALHAEDPRKLTRETIALLRRAAEHISETQKMFADPKGQTVADAVADGELYSQIHELADAIESYLPPAL